MIDLFSKHSEQYAQFRPTYPDALYQFIFSQVNSFDAAWDCGTGNGQAAHVLARKFKKVHASDISANQIEQAVKFDNLFYSVAGEETTFLANSIDLITVAQAIHWFDLNKFYQEVNRVAKPNAVIAVWGYSLLSVNSDMDPLIQNFYKNVVGPYWNKERKLIDEEYKTISFPFAEIKSPAFEFSFQWTKEQLEGYLTTWSAVQKYLQTNQVNPVVKLMEEISPFWTQDLVKVTFPLFLRLGRVNPE
jgi:ubiquinone/menaquinone biosynthesis C-methylase UbiE